MKKVIITCIVLATTLFSCGNNSTQEKNDNKGKVTISVASWALAAKSLGDIAKEYEKIHPNVNINVLDFDAQYTKLTPILVSQSNVPDIIQLQARNGKSFFDKFDGEFLDITDQFKADGYDKSFLPSSIVPVTYNNKIYAFPWDIAPVAVYYRKDMFKKAGINPDSIKTWDDYISAGKKLMKALPGVSMTANVAKSPLFQILFNEADGQMVKDGMLALNSKEGLQATEMLSKLDKSGIVLNVSTGSAAILAVSNSKVASMIQPVWYAGILKNSASNLSGKWGIIPLPSYKKGEEGRANLGGSILAISSTSKNKKIAYDFIKYVLTNDEGENINLKYAIFPAYAPYYNNPNFKTVDPYFGVDINSIFAKLAVGIPKLEYGTVMLDAETPLNNLAAAIITGANPQEALNKATESISKLTGVKIYKENK